MHLFSIRQSNKVKKPIQITGYDEKKYHYKMSYEECQALPKLAVAYYTEMKDMEYPAIIHTPTFLINDDLKRLLKLYDDELVCKGLHVYDDRLDENHVQMQKYWTLGAKSYPCVHKDVKFYPNGSMEKLILQKDKIPKKDIFRVADIQEERVIVSEAVLESILRRHMYGISFEEIEIRR